MMQNKNLGFFISNANKNFKIHSLFEPTSLFKDSLNRHPVYIEQKSETILHITPLGTQPIYGPAGRHLCTQETGAPGVHLYSYKDKNNQTITEKSVQCVRPTIIVEDTPENIKKITAAFKHELQNNNLKVIPIIQDTATRIKDFDFNTNLKLDPQNIIVAKNIESSIERIAKELKIPEKLKYKDDNPLYQMVLGLQNGYYENLKKTNTNKILTEISLNAYHDLNDPNKNPGKIWYAVAAKVEKQISLAQNTGELIPKVEMDYIKQKTRAIMYQEMSRIFKY